MFAWQANDSQLFLSIRKTIWSVLLLQNINKHKRDSFSCKERGSVFSMLPIVWLKVSYQSLLSFCYAYSFCRIRIYATCEHCCYVYELLIAVS